VQIVHNHADHRLLSHEAIAALTVAMAAWVFWIRLFTAKTVPSWPSTVIPIWFLGGIQLVRQIHHEGSALSLTLH
jgi:hypothetical protein